MDVAEWGRHQHELHSRVAPLRAAEYQIPIFRVASSGVSQAVDPNGRVVAKTSIGGVEEILTVKFLLPAHGSLPFDRILAPSCVVATGIVVLVLPFLAWKQNRKTA
jgi:apolipoprotein N-acyltransferase